MNVSEIMAKTVITVSADASVGEVAQLLADNHVSGLPVVGPDGRLIGMITEEDVVVRDANPKLPTLLNLLDGLFPVRGQREYDEEVRHILASRASELMSEHLYTVKPDADVSEAATLMVEKHANPIPVVEQGTLVGMIGRGDIIRLIARLEREAAAQRG
jgi:CBS domain-containing protein